MAEVRTSQNTNDVLRLVLVLVVVGSMFNHPARGSHYVKAPRV